MWVKMEHLVETHPLFNIAQILCWEEFFCFPLLLTGIEKFFSFSLFFSVGIHLPRTNKWQSATAAMHGDRFCHGRRLNQRLQTAIVPLFLQSLFSPVTLKAATHLDACSHKVMYWSKARFFRLLCPLALLLKGQHTSTSLVFFSYFLGTTGCRISPN
jgi:hypothetical protein